MGFMFGGINVSSSKKTLAAEMIEDIVQIHKEGEGPFYLFLLDEKYPPQKLNKIEIFIKNQGITNYKAVCALNVDIRKDDIKGLTEFYRTNQSKWKQHINGARAIISVGAALYAINQSSDIMVDGFYDIIFNKSYYWSPDAKSFVFPIDSFHEIMQAVPGRGDELGAANLAVPANTYKTQFAKRQLIFAQNSRLVKPWGTEAERLQITYSHYLQITPDTSKVYLVDIETKEQFIHWCQNNYHSKKMAWDLETSGLNPISNEIGIFTASFNGRVGFFVTWNHVDKVELNKLLGSVKMQIGANLKFDVKFMWKNGITNATIHNDTVQLGHVLNEQRLNGLKSHAFLYTSFGGYDRELDRYRERTGIDNYLLIPKSIIFPYATLDPIVTYIVDECLQQQVDMIDVKYPNEKIIEWNRLHPNQKLSNWGMRRYYEEIMLPAVNAFAEIEFRGVYTDKEQLAKSREAMHAEVKQLELELSGIWQTPPDFDFNSGKKLGMLFERLGWEDLGRSLNGDYLTSEAELTRWRLLGHVGCSEMIRLRSVKTILKTFISSETAEDGAEKGWEQYLRWHEEDTSWRMHPTFNVMRTESGRCKSDSPNMQNVPAHGDLAALVKKCIATPNPDDFYLCTVDYASLQIRLAAIDTNLNPSSRDEVLYNVYTDPKMGADLHSVTGFSIFAKNKEFELEVIEVGFPDGNIKTFFADEYITTQNRGKIKAGALQPEDIL